MTIDPRTATAEQLAEYLMIAMGFERWDRWPEGFYADRVTRTQIHPAEFAGDMNMVLRAMPLGWVWQKNDFYWFAFWPPCQRGTPGFSTKNTGDERLDRLRLAALAWEAQNKERT
jgi:hypothetical protein